MTGLPARELDGIRRGGKRNFHRLLDVLNARKKAGLVEESVVNGHIKAATGVGVKEAVEAVGFHGMIGMRSFVGRCF